jgi:DNA-binding NtrC family response regulator
MIVDDDRSMVRLLQTLLTLDGFTVSHEARPAEIVKAIRADRPDVVLMDKNLAGADGLAILREIRTDAELKSLPVIIASGEDVAFQCQQAGANEFMLKPYSPDQLTEAIKKVIAQ